MWSGTGRVPLNPGPEDGPPPPSGPPSGNPLRRRRHSLAARPPPFLCSSEALGAFRAPRRVGSGLVFPSQGSFFPSTRFVDECILDMSGATSKRRGYDPSFPPLAGTTQIITRAAASG